MRVSTHKHTSSLSCEPYFLGDYRLHIRLLVNSPETFEAAAAQYRKYRRRSYFSYWVFWISYASLVPTSFMVSGGKPGFVISSPYAWILGVVVLVVLASLLLRVRYRRLTSEALPSIEARTLFFLQPAVTSLANLIQHRSESYRRECLKHLAEAAGMIDGWTIGNLRFIENEFGSKLTDFKKNFKLRLIPAVKGADSATARKIHSFLGPLQTKLIFGVDGASFEVWNNFLGQFAETKPKPKPVQRLASKTVALHLVFLISVVSITYEYFGFLRTSVGADVNASTTGANVLLGIMLTPYAGYLFWKYIYRERGAKAS